MLMGAAKLRLFFAVGLTCIASSCDPGFFSSVGVGLSADGSILIYVHPCDPTYAAEEVTLNEVRSAVLQDADVLWRIRGSSQIRIFTVGDEPSGFETPAGAWLVPRRVPAATRGACRGRARRR